MTTKVKVKLETDKIGEMPDLKEGMRVLKSQKNGKEIPTLKTKVEPPKLEADGKAPVLKVDETRLDAVGLAEILSEAKKIEVKLMTDEEKVKSDEEIALRRETAKTIGERIVEIDDEINRIKGRREPWEFSSKERTLIQELEAEKTRLDGLSKKDSSLGGNVEFAKLLAGIRKIPGNASRKETIEVFRKTSEKRPEIKQINDPERIKSLKEKLFNEKKGESNIFYVDIDADVLYEIILGEEGKISKGTKAVAGELWNFLKRRQAEREQKKAEKKASYKEEVENLKNNKQVAKKTGDVLLTLADVADKPPKERTIVFCHAPAKPEIDIREQNFTVVFEKGRIEPGEAVGRLDLEFDGWFKLGVYVTLDSLRRGELPFIKENYKAVSDFFDLLIDALDASSGAPKESAEKPVKEEEKVEKKEEIKPPLPEAPETEHHEETAQVVTPADTAGAKSDVKTGDGDDIEKNPEHQPENTQET